MKSSKTFLCLLLILAALSASLTGCASNMENEVNPQNSLLTPGSDDSSVTGASEDSDVATTNEPYVAINEVNAADNEAYAAANETYETANEAYVAAASAFHDSDGIDDNGYWNGVRALDLVELFDISAVAFPASDYPIDPAKVESAMISYLRKTAPMEQITDRPVAEGDKINFDFIGTTDGYAPDELSNTNMTIRLDNVIAAQIIGHTPGETFEAYGTVSDYEIEELRGKDTVVVVTVNYIYQPVEPELTDAYIAENYSTSNNWNSVAEMRAKFEEDLKADSIYRYIVYHLIPQTPVSSIPAALTQHGFDEKVTIHNNSAINSKMSLEDYLAKFYDTRSLEEVIKTYASGYTHDLKKSLVVQAIAEKTGMVVTSDELQTYYSDNYNADRYETDLRKHGEPYMKQQLLEDKVINYIKEHLV
ncbi:MAG: hypothetical protein LBT59_23025 [Clostridiales bacterium]|jgi:trigger factor|nr:hypothetical protein [Clostridiales bacterium]